MAARKKNTPRKTRGSLISRRKPRRKKRFPATRRFFKKLWKWTKKTGRAIKWWWGLPNWLKWAKVAVVAVVLLAPSVYEWGERKITYHRIYDEYYAHFYQTYQKTLITDSHAQRYASFYADFYAEYYSSPAYRAYLQNALPVATAETISFPPDSKVAGLHINDSGLNLIKEFEGLRLEPYKDVGGKLTIGYGHLVRPGEYYGMISEAEAAKLLREDIKVAEAYVKRYVTVPLNGNQFAALVSLVYNIGPGNFRKSTMLEHLNDGEMDKAAAEFPRWKRVGKREVKGLSRRRSAEKELFES